MTVFGFMQEAYDAIVAGAGLWGCTVARRLAESGLRVLVLEKREAVGGNCRCQTVKGMEVHCYGSHIFHTSDESVWRFVNRFASFNQYRHKVLANYRGDIYHLPIGCTLLQEFFGKEVKPSELTERDRIMLFDAFVRGYTSKQWGMPPEKVDPSVIARLKVRDTHSTDYFDDVHQGIPIEGYNRIFARLLAHPNICVKCGTPFALPSTPHHELVCPVFYSGPIDQLFGYCHGHLPWRTLRFETEHLSQSNFQGAAVVNYSDVAVPYTRIHEFRHYHKEESGAFSNPQGTIVMREYSESWHPGDEPYYPIDSEVSRRLVEKYRLEVESVNRASLKKGGKLVVGGRLGEYRYYDMDKTIAAALSVQWRHGAG